MKKKLLFIISFLLLFASVAIAADTTYTTKVYHKQGGDEEVVASGGQITVESGGEIEIESGGTIEAEAGSTVNVAGTLTVTGTFANSRERGFSLPLMGFVLSDGSPVTASTAPGIEIDDAMPNIVWADGETTPVIITFRVPYDYSSGGAFRVFATESDSTTPNQIDFDVYVNRAGSAIDSAATGQTPVALDEATSTPSVVTLTPATDFASLAAGDWVTLRIWRDDVAAGSGDLEVKGVEFFYTASR